MLRRKWGWITAGAIAAAVGMTLGLAGSPAQATGSTGTITDADGVDYDPTCLLDVPTIGRVANSVASPGGTGCAGSTFYDGSAEAADIRSASLESTSTGRLKGSITVDGALPAPGDTNMAAIDGPTGQTTYVRYALLFQNKDKQHGADNPLSGCQSTLVTRYADRHGHWADGYHYYLMYSIDYLDGRWVHTLSVGEYATDNPPGYEPLDIAYNNGGGWTTSSEVGLPMVGRWAASMTGTGPTTLDMEVSGRIHRADANCASPSGYFVWDMASNSPGPFSGPGYTSDTIANVKAMSLIDMVLGPPVPGTGWPGTLSWNGYTDITAGASTAGVLGTNIPGIALTMGLTDGKTENFANGPFCRPGTAGFHVQNPLSTLQPNQPCQIDDDPVARGSAHLEWWETAYGFSF